MVDRLLGRAQDVRSVLEIGAGMGSLGVILARRYEDYVGLELDRHSYEVASARFERAGVYEMINGDLTALPSDRLFDLVCAFEVLEHFEDDAVALEEWRTRVRVGGWLLISVPAGPERFGAADAMSGHFRRYDRTDLAALLARCGFEEPVTLAYGFPAGYLLEAGRNVIARRHLRRKLSNGQRTAASGRWLQPPEAAARLMRVNAAPLQVLQRPFAQGRFGTGLVALARRAS